MADIVIAQTTSDDEDGARALARGAVESRLAAGVHIDAPITAFYWWNGEVQTAREWRISYMTTTDRLPRLEAWVSERHPYEVPQWVVLPVTDGSEAYLSWVIEETARS
ncbi:divalent-cation tolerance protein CutA [Streptomyces sp. J2-1]|uniref:divalent-cation tolerance protein CutA n=1 Tax=Streptomyces corallincola TaxID=2851888 RepID=UPI001C38A86C|nr:divalent-cation tolerance protein CutA [Streptomyces corallincola]MBV2353340.1 divalent-cation tolerance protein CutA [Streptomyces corallincola]